MDGWDGVCCNVDLLFFSRVYMHKYLISMIYDDVHAATSYYYYYTWLG